MAFMRDVAQPFIGELEPDDLDAAAECQELAEGEFGGDSSGGVGGLNPGVNGESHMSQ
jgi:hypothetical protein